MPTLTIAGTVQFPLASEANPPSTSFSSSVNYTERNVDDVDFSGAVNDIDLMGRITDAKACFIQMLIGEGTLKINGSTDETPVATSGNGFWVWVNPVGGLTALTITTAAAARVRVFMFT